MIRLGTVIGHGVNLIPHFIKHYKNYVDEIQIVVYQSNVEPNLIEEVTEIIKNYDNVKIIKTIEDRVFDWEKVTQLYNFIKSKKPNDWWVIADIDEFHLYPNDDIENCIQNCENNGWLLMRGGFIDRIGKDGEFIELKKNTNIFAQYPNMGFFRYPMSKACPNKICIVKGDIEITAGQHYAKIDGHTTWRWQGWNHPLIAPVDVYNVQVHHFKWDKTVIDRIKKIADIKKEYAYSDEYFKMYQSLRNSNFQINLLSEEYEFENCPVANFDSYKGWKKLFNKIISI